MAGRRSTVWAVVALVVLGAVGVALRLHFRSDVQMSRGDSIWRITYSVGFHAAKSGAHVRVAIAQPRRMPKPSRMSWTRRRRRPSHSGRNASG